MQNNSILEQLKRVPHGTLLKVLWLDAATVKGAKITKVPLPNYYVETKRATIGSYICLQPGQYQKSYHIVLEMDNTEGTGSMIRSIPVCLIYKIIVPSVKEAESTEVAIVGKKRQLIEHEKKQIRLEDGSVKFLD